MTTKSKPKADAAPDPRRKLAAAQAQVGELFAATRDRIQEGVAAIHDALAGIRDELDKRRDELHAARAVQVTRPEAELAAREAVGELARTGGARQVPVPHTYERPWEAVKYMRDVPAAELLAAVQPELLVGWMMAAADEGAEARGGWSEVAPEARQAEIQRLELEVLELEAAENKAIRAAKEAGVVFDYFPKPPRPPGTYNSLGERIG